MHMNGWSNTNGPSGHSFGVYFEGQPHPLAADHPLFEVLRQATDLLIHNKDKGFVCGKETHVTTTNKGAKTVVLETTWVTARITERLGKQGYSLSLDLPFGDSRNIPGSNPQERSALIEII